VMIGTEGNAAVSQTCGGLDPNEKFLYAAPAVGLGGFPPRLAAL
jgi:hypothetical protein